MDKEALKNFGIDYDNAVRRFAGNEALYEKYLLKFTEDDHLQAGCAAMEQKNYPEMFEAIHALKSVTGTLGMTELFAACSEVVAALRAEQTERIQELMEKVQKEHEKICRVCRQDN